MTNVSTFNQVEHLLADVVCVLGDALERSGDQHQAHARGAALGVRSRVLRQRNTWASRASTRIADDSATVRALTRSLVAPVAGQSTSAPTARPAVAAYVAHRPDVVLMDIAMPGLDGINAPPPYPSIQPRASSSSRTTTSPTCATPRTQRVPVLS
jgi:hypothetical protein